jgi:hypothetical protein
MKTIEVKSPITQPLDEFKTAIVQVAVAWRARVVCLSKLEGNGPVRQTLGQQASAYQHLLFALIDELMITSDAKDQLPRASQYTI